MSRVLSNMVSVDLQGSKKRRELSKKFEETLLSILKNKGYSKDNIQYIIFYGDMLKMNVDPDTISAVVTLKDVELNGLSEIQKNGVKVWLSDNQAESEKLIYQFTDIGEPNKNRMKKAGGYAKTGQTTGEMGMFGEKAIENYAKDLKNQLHLSRPTKEMTKKYVDYYKKRLKKTPVDRDHPVDMIQYVRGEPKFAIEIKSLSVDRKRHQLRMVKPARKRKKAFARANKLKTKTIAIVQDFGNKEFRVYEKPGFKDYRVKNMKHVVTFEMGGGKMQKTYSRYEKLAPSEIASVASIIREKMKLNFPNIEQIKNYKKYFSQRGERDPNTTGVDFIRGKDAINSSIEFKTSKGWESYKGYNEPREAEVFVESNKLNPKSLLIRMNFPRNIVRAYEIDGIIKGKKLREKIRNRKAKVAEFAIVPVEKRFYKKYLIMERDLWIIKQSQDKIPTEGRYSLQTFKKQNINKYQNLNLLYGNSVHNWKLPKNMPKVGEKAIAIQQPVGSKKSMVFDGIINKDNKERLHLDEVKGVDITDFGRNKVTFNVFTGKNKGHYELAKRRFGRNWVISRSDNFRMPIRKQFKPASVKKKIDKDMLVSPEWVVEPMVKGNRGLLYVDRNENRLLSKNIETGGENYIEKTDNLPHIRNHKWRKNLTGTVLDGQVFKKDLGTTSKIMKTNPIDSRKMQKKEGKPTFIAFDILKYRNQDTRNWPYEQRRALLKRVIGRSTDYIKMLPMITKNKIGAIKNFMKQGWDGAILKNRYMPYGDNFMGKIEKENLTKGSKTIKMKSFSESEIEKDPTLRRFNRLYGDKVGKLLTNYGNEYFKVKVGRHTLIIPGNFIKHNVITKTFANTVSRALGAKRLKSDEIERWITVGGKKIPIPKEGNVGHKPKKGEKVSTVEERLRRKLWVRKALKRNLRFLEGLSEDKKKKVKGLTKEQIHRAAKLAGTHSTSKSFYQKLLEIKKE